MCNDSDCVCVCDRMAGVATGGSSSTDKPTAVADKDKTTATIPDTETKQSGLRSQCCRVCDSIKEYKTDRPITHVYCAAKYRYVIMSPIVADTPTDLALERKSKEKYVISFWSDVYGHPVVYTGEYVTFKNNHPSPPFVRCYF